MSQERRDALKIQVTLIPMSMTSTNYHQGSNSCESELIRNATFAKPSGVGRLPIIHVHSTSLSFVETQAKSNTPATTSLYRVTRQFPVTISEK